MRGKKGLWLGFVGLVQRREGLWQGNETAPFVVVVVVGNPAVQSRGKWSVFVWATF